jgi:ankyrin repeat protein
MGCLTQKKAGSTLFDDRSEDRGHPAGLVDGRLHPKVVLCPTCARFVGLISTRSRNIQTQLSILLPENAKEWRRYRPNGINKGKDRLTALKNCREYQNSKRLRHTPQPKATLKKADMTAFGLKQVQVANPFYDPGRHYDSIHCKGVPSHSTFPTLNQSFWNQSPSRSSSGSDSDKEVVCAVSTDTPNEGRTPSDMLDSRYYSQYDSKAPTPTAREPVSNNGIADTDSSQSESHSEPRRDDEVVPLVVEDGTPPALNTTSITRSSSRASRSGGASIRTMSTRISSRASISWSHVSSVLAATLSSGFSHRYSASSSFADLSRLDNTSTPWSRDEFESWNELVDQTRLHSAPLQLPSHAGSLHQRPCCGRFKEIPYTQTIRKCNVCGYNGKFQLARHVKIRLFDPGAQDRFGNTALHHAMAAGNLWGIKVWMDDTEHSSNVDLSHRNTSGETFLHVCRIQKSEQFITYTEILKTVAQRGFDFSIRDHSGRTIAQRLHELTDEWDKIDENQLLEAGTIFRMKKNPNANDLQGDEWQLPHSLLLPPPIERGTLLLNRLRQFPYPPIRGFELPSLVQHSDIHIRDERGYTALARAARLGFTDACDLLLQNGANPNTRSYQGTSVIAHATAHLIQAQQSGDSELYSRILSCIVQLTDHGAKLIVSDYDEFAIDALKEVKRKTSIRDKFLKPLLKSKSIMMRKNKRKLGTIEEKPMELEDTDRGLSELGGGQLLGLGGGQIHKLDTYRPSVLADTSRIPELEATSTWSVRTGTLADQSSLNCVYSFKPPDSSQRIDPSAGDDCCFSNIYAQPATSSWYTRQTGVQHSQCDGPAEFRCQPVIIDGYLSQDQPVSLSKSMFGNSPPYSSFLITLFSRARLLRHLSIAIQCGN